MVRRMAVAAGCAVALLAAPGQAAAVPASAPVAGWPQVDGSVRAMALVGNRLYIAGSFTQVGGQPHANIAVLDATTGAVDSGFTAATDGPVYALAVSGSDLLIGGQFLKVNTTNTRPRLAAVNLSTGAFDAAFDPKVESGLVSALAVAGSRLYAGGININLDPGSSPPAPNPRSLWAFNATTGAADVGFNGLPAPSAERVRTVLVSAARLLVGGDFTSVNAVNKPYLVALDPAAGTVESSFDAQVDGPVYALAASGNRVYLSGTFAHVRAQPRVALARIDRASGAPALGWRADADGIMAALAASDSRIYAGGTTSTFGSLGQRTVVAARLDTGAISTLFAPNFGTTPFVGALAISNTFMFAGGSFTTVGGQPHMGLVAFRLQKPVSISAPFIRGNPVTGAKISCAPGSWRNDPASFAYRWLRAGSPIAGATASSYRVVKADEGRRVACRVTASNPPGSTVATSAAVIPAAPDKTKPAMKIGGKQLRMSGTGTVKVRLSCPSNETRCSGTVLLRALETKGEPLLAVRGFALAGGRTHSFELQLSDDARDLVTRRGQLPVRVQVNARDAVGNAARIRGKLTLSAS
jgi:hypothetical protein